MPQANPSDRETQAPPAYDTGRLQAGLAWAALCLSCISLIGGWMLEFDALVRLKPGYPAIVQTTLACAMLSSTALLLITYRPPRHSELILAIAGGIGMVAVLALYGNSQVRPQDDHMSLGTALGFLLFAATTILRQLAHDGAQTVALKLATLGAALSLLPLVAYALDSAALWQSAIFAAMSPLTAVLLLLLFGSLLLTLPRQGWVGTLLSDGPGGRMSRRYIPFAITAPIVLSYLGLNLSEVGVRYTAFHLGLVTVATIAIAVWAILWTSGLENERQAAARRDAAQLRVIVESFDSAAVFVLDATGRVEMRNSLAEDMVADGQELVDQDVFALSDRRVLSGDAHPVRRLMRGPDDQDILAGWVGPDGTERVLSFSAIRLPADQPERARVLLSIEDHTESWLLRTALSDNQRSEAVGQLTWGVAHEMANIFGIVQISAESARLEAVSAKTGQNLDAILQACRRGTDLTHKLLEMTRNIESEPELLNVVSVLKSVADLAGRVMPSFVDFQMRYPDRPCMLRCKRTDLEGAVLNLLANARNAIAEAGRGRGVIELEITEADGQLSIVVSDDGPGIPQDLVDRVRDPYFTTRRSSGGRGIGLTLVDTFARRVGGTFAMIPRETGGTRCIVQLPLSQETAPETKVTRMPGTTDLSGYRILLAESDVPFRRSLTDGLRAMGADVATAEDGQTASDWLEHQDAPDVLITNFQLPDGVRGAALADVLQTRAPRARVIYLSGAADARDTAQVEGLVLSKPVHLAELAGAIELEPPVRPE